MAGTFTASQIWQLTPPAVGCDFLPLRHAAQSLLDGSSIYRDPAFVYPPAAAVALLPAAVATETTAFLAWLVIIFAALTTTAVLITRAAAADVRRYVFPATLMVLLGGVVAQRSLYAGNLSAVLAPVAVAVLLAFHRGRWLLGCTVLAASLLVKPLLAPLILIPLLARRWRPFARAMLPAGALLLLSLVVVPGGTRFPAVLMHSLAGSNLHGTEAANNLSLRGWVEAHHLHPAIGVAASVAVVAAAVLRGREVRDPTWLGSVLLLTTFLAGAIGEANYLFAAAAAAILHAVVSRPPRLGDRLACLPGLGIMALPIQPDAATAQTWLVIGQILLLGALLWRIPDPRSPATTRRATSSASAEV